MSDGHQFVLKIEDGYTSWRLVCPDDNSCGPANVCGSCGRTIGDDEIEPCYDCPTTAEADKCWAQSWVGSLMAEEVIHGTVEVQFPVHLQWNGDGLEAHVVGPTAPVSQPETPGEPQ